jgi:hypothetical protein
MKNAQRALLVIAGMAVLAACSLFSVNSLQKSNGSTSATIADGTRPMPPIPPSGTLISYGV